MKKMILVMSILLATSPIYGKKIDSFKNLWGFDSDEQAIEAAKVEMALINSSQEYGDCKETRVRDVENLKAYKISKPFMNFPRFGTQIKVYYRCNLRRN